ncbi:hypothetical protein A1O3_09576 [Capronia epimyces CBS 606.96]|uniref:Xylanolytic transcriptional activator regulatory domain-containing protein n=1 Tax=Capronia epimyces CBS 606.96 TaxID=1182542 RepID=W9XJ53_9EURO|nr:uncharacterized protein A1O3_09576 [Capronia epimyces CBS 606.96]EXJ77350.1 hypothetical protein A1O3_09576 [Capronia epimyces CBS 606.96]
MDLDWLSEPSIPDDKARLRSLAVAYFDRVHPQRCLGFIHKPTFMHFLDRGVVSLCQEYGEALVFTICALGAWYLLRHTPAKQPAHPRAPGQEWALGGRRRALDNLGTPSINNLRALVLSCEYCFLRRDFATSFSLIGCCYRLARLLRLDSVGFEEDERTRAHSAANPTETESRRRLLWACYILDTSVGSGVDANTCWRDGPPQVPLPCPESDFINQRSGAIVRLSANGAFVPPAPESVGIRAYVVRLSCLRSRVLRLIRQHNLSTDPWHPESPFMRLINETAQFHADLSRHCALTDLNLYIQKEQHLVGAIHYLHLAYHASVIDLTRIALPGFSFPLASTLAHAPPTFRTQCQQRCRYHASEISKIIRRAREYGPEAFDDHFCNVATFESTKAQIIYCATVRPHDAALRLEVAEDIRTNLSLLAPQEPPVVGKQPSKQVRGLLPLLYRFGFEDIAKEWDDEGASGVNQEIEVVGSAKFDYLSQTAAFRQAAETEMETNRAVHGQPGLQSKRSERQDPPVIDSIKPSDALGSFDGSDMDEANRHHEGSSKYTPERPAPPQQGLEGPDYLNTARNMPDLMWDLPYQPAWSESVFLDQSLEDPSFWWSEVP